jgi:light-regulated signal transduction histidine kinase (bacteriophytochrome)
MEIESRKQAQRLLAEANQSLEDKVRERTKELTKKNEELETMNYELQQFAWVVSHDLIEPLRKIQTFNTIIREKYLQDSQEARHYIERSIAASGRMNNLIRDLLDYSRLTKDSAFEETDLNRLLKDLLDDLEDVIREKKGEISVAEFPKLQTIPGQLRQVFQNLILNALKFSSPERRPVIKINSELVNEKKIDSAPAVNGAFCRITVEDNGIGFDEKFLDRIFVIFQRLHNSNDYEGTGIGLAIVNKIISKHNGIISARSTEGKGTTFIIVLPVKHS